MKTALYTVPECRISTRLPGVRRHFSPYRTRVHSRRPKDVRTLKSLVTGRRTGLRNFTLKGATRILWPDRVIRFDVSTSSTKPSAQPPIERKTLLFAPKNQPDTKPIGKKG